jgi:hypothetical protein
MVWFVGDAPGGSILADAEKTAGGMTIRDKDKLQEVMNARAGTKLDTSFKGRSYILPVHALREGQ